MRAPHLMVLDQVRERIKHCERMESMIRTVLDWVEADGRYDAMHDQYLVRLPGIVIRELTALSGERSQNQNQQ